jgi:glycerol kinase
VTSGNEEALVLALDQGGQSSRAIVFDANGRAIAKGSRAVAERRIGDDRVEQDPEEIVRSLSEAGEEAVAALGSRAGDLAGVGLATQRSSLACWDRSSGRALSPVISWQDRRASAWLERFESDAQEIHRRTGLLLSPHYGASKIAWCLEHLPEVARARDEGQLSAGPLSSFLAHRSLRERPLAADPANASRTLLYSIAERGWDPWLCARFGIPREILPACVATHAEHGELDLARRRVPLRVVTGDQSAAIFAEGEPALDAAYVNLGTGAFVQRPLRGEPILLPRLLTSLVSTRHGSRAPGADSALFVIEGTINGAGSALRWIAEREKIADVEARLDAWLADVRDPPLFLNGVSGLAAPYWAPGFASRFVGEGSTAQRVVAVIESVLFLVTILLDEMRSSVAPPARIEVSGGLSRSDALCARLADAAELPVRRAADPEATARGLAWQVLGRDVSWRANDAQTFEPRDDPSLRRRRLRFREELERALGARPRTI